MTLARVAWHPAAVFADLTSHGKGAAFLTQVAGTAVLGKQCVLLGGWPAVGKWLWVVAVLLWVGLIYTFPIATSSGIHHVAAPQNKVVKPSTNGR